MTSPTWQRIDTWLRASAPEVLRRLRPPIEPATLAKLEATAGKPLPASLVEAYLAHDGAAGEHPTVFGAVRAPKDALWARHMWWLPADRAVGSVLFMRELSVDVPDSKTWPAALLPIAEDGGGNKIVVDLDSGEVSAWDHEDGTTTKLAADVGTWMTQLADDMQAGLVIAGNEYEDTDDTLTLLDAPPPPPKPAPVIARDRAARVFVEVLVEKRLAVVRKGADLEPLIAALTVALAIKTTATKKKKVIELLEESDAVEEIFGGDDKIEALVDEVA